MSVHHSGEFVVFPAVESLRIISAVFSLYKFPTVHR